MVAAHAEAVVHKAAAEEGTADLPVVELVAVAGFAAPRQLHLQALVLLWWYFALNYCRYARLLPFNCPEFHRKGWEITGYVECKST